MRWEDASALRHPRRVGEARRHNDDVSVYRVADHGGDLERRPGVDLRHLLAG